jgi:hypothetical protein
MGWLHGAVGGSRLVDSRRGRLTLDRFLLRAGTRWEPARTARNPLNYERAPDGGIDLAQRYLTAEAGSQQITYLAFKKTSKRGRANVDYSRNNDDSDKKSEHHKHPPQMSNEKIHRSEVLPDTEIKLPTAVAARLLSRKSEIEVDFIPAAGP